MTKIVDIVNNGLKSEGLPALTAGLYLGTEDAALILQQKANEANRELAREFEWPQLLKIGTITLVNGTTTYALPSDFDSWVFNTIYNQNDRWALQGPMTPQEYQERQWSFVSYLNRQRYIIMGYTPTDFVLSPTPQTDDAGKIISFFYVSSNRVTDGGTPAIYAADFTDDNEQPVLDEDALRYRIMAHYFRTKGLAAEPLAVMAQARSVERIAAIRGAGPIYVGSRGRRATRFLNNWNAPDTGYG